MTLIFPSIMVALSILSAVVYATHGDLRHTIYWAAAAALTASVTY